MRYSPVARQAPGVAYRPLRGQIRTEGGQAPCLKQQKSRCWRPCIWAFPSEGCTLHAISGLLRSASGSITLDGTDLQSVPANSIIRMGLAHVPEGRHVFAQMTVEENLKMGAYTISDARLVAENMERVYGHFPRLKERRRQLAEDDRVRKAYLGA